MGKGLDNYYLILGLDFAKPESDIQVIQQRLKEKTDFWNRNADKGTMQQKYRQYKSQVLDIGKVMTTKELRTAEASDAMQFVSGILKEELRFFAGKKEIEETAAKAMMEKCGLWPEMFETLSGLKIIPDQNAKKTQDEDPNPKPDKLAKFRKYTPDLDIVHKENLYDFLAGDQMEGSVLQALDGAELIQGYSDPLKKRVKNGRTEEDVATKSLCAACEEVFDPKNGQLRVNYDKYLIWQKIDAVINRMVKYAGMKKSLEAQQAELFTDELTQILRSREEAEKRFRQICGFKDIRAGGGAAQQAEIRQRVLCGHCFQMSDISHGERRCTFCGKDLYLVCPQCAKEAAVSSKACGHCGFVFENIKKAEIYCDRAQQALKNMELDKAAGALAKAAELAQKYKRIHELQKQLGELQATFSKEIAKMNQLAAEKKFYQAAQILRSLQKKAPAAEIADAVLIETAVREAERLYQQAVRETSEQKLIEACSGITGICPDYPGVEALLLKYRPGPPAALRILCDPRTGSNLLTWEKSPSAGTISYKILRKANAAADSMQDPAAEEIGTAGDAEFTDTSPKSGVTYYYSVYAMRAGVSSDPVCASAVNLSQIQFIAKEEGDGYIRLEWEPLQQNARLAVCRGEDAAPQKISDGKMIRAADTFLLDDTVENDRCYYYQFFVTYQTGRKDTVVLTTAGPLIPSALPEPADGLTVRVMEDCLFEAKWQDPGKGRIRLYYTRQRVSLKYGDITTLDKVERFLKPVDSVSYAAGCCRFRLDGTGSCAVIPVTIKGQTAVIGEQAAVMQVEKIQVQSMEQINSNLRITIRWPKDAASVLAIYGNDGYALDLEDRRGKTVRNFSKEKYEADTGIYLQNIEKKDYYIVLYSAVRLNGELIYSEGTQVFYANRPKADIRYAIRVKGFINKQIEVEFLSDETEFYLPDVDLVCRQGSPPVYVTSGKVVEHIDRQEVQGSCKVIFPLEAVPKNSYLKPFFSDEDSLEKLSLRPVYGTNFKVR